MCYTDLYDPLMIFLSFKDETEDEPPIEPPPPEGEN